MAEEKEGPSDSPEEGKPVKICCYKGCNSKTGLKKSKTGNWYCFPHHPNNREKAKAAARKGAMATARVKREKKDAALFCVKIEPNKASLLNAMVAQANYLAEGIGPNQLRKHNLLANLVERIMEHATEEGGEAQKEQRVVAILDSKLPATIKVSKLVDIVGPTRAMELVEIDVERNAYEDHVLDGEKMLRDQQSGKAGAASVDIPDSFKHIPISDEAEELPPVALDAVEGDPIDASGKPHPGPVSTEPKLQPPPMQLMPPGQEKGPPASPAAPPAADAAPVAPVAKAPAPPVPASDAGRRGKCAQQAKELLKLYLTNVKGNFTPPDQVAKSFFDALMDGVEYKELFQRVRFPKSDTDQAAMMIKDVKDRRKTA